MIEKHKVKPSKNIKKIIHESVDYDKCIGKTDQVKSNNSNGIMPFPQVYAIYWGQEYTQKIAPYMNKFFQDVLGDTYMDGLSQYGVSKGTFIGSTIINLSIPSILTDSDIGNVLNNILDSGTIPTPSSDEQNKLYVLFTPYSTEVQNGEYSSEPNDSTSEMGGYHGSRVYGKFDFLTSGNLFYAVIPWKKRWTKDVSDDTLDQITISTSHELVESFTDINDSGFVNSSGCEIADVCDSSNLRIRSNSVPQTYLVTKYWSNKDNSCIIPGGFEVIPPFSVNVSIETSTNPPQPLTIPMLAKEISSNYPLHTSSWYLNGNGHGQGTQKIIGLPVATSDTTSDNLFKIELKTSTGDPNSDVDVPVFIRTPTILLKYTLDRDLSTKTNLPNDLDPNIMIIYSNNFSTYVKTSQGSYQVTLKSATVNVSLNQDRQGMWNNPQIKWYVNDEQILNNSTTQLVITFDETALKKYSVKVQVADLWGNNLQQTIVLTNIVYVIELPSKPILKKKQDLSDLKKINGVPVKFIGDPVFDVSVRNIMIDGNTYTKSKKLIQKLFSLKNN